MSLLRGAKLVPETTDPISDKASGRQRSELGEDFRTEGNQPGPFCRQVLRACPARCNQNPHFPPPHLVEHSLCVGPWLWVCWCHVFSFKQRSHAAEEGCCSPFCTRKDAGDPGT